MESLSRSNSLVTLISLTGSTCSVLNNLRKDCSALPGRLHALNNEVVDLMVVLHQVDAAIAEKISADKESNVESSISQHVKQGVEKLLAVNEILCRIHAVGSRKMELLSQTVIWKREQARLAMLQDDIKRVKSHLNILLGASNSRDMMRINLGIERLSSITMEATQDHADFRQELFQGLLAFHDNIAESLSHKQSRVEERLERVEALLQAQSTRIQVDQESQIGSLYSVSPPPFKRRETRRLSSFSEDQMKAKIDAVGFRLKQYQSTCRTSCACSCHNLRRYSSTSPTSSTSLMSRVLGQIFVGFAGLPKLNEPCDSNTCGKAQIPSVSLEYWFPMGFCWSQIVRLQMAYDKNSGPALQLRMLRRVSDSAPCVNFALEGNIDGLKNLFSRGQASPCDVSSTRGYSLLRWALYGQQYETCKFLMLNGADPTYRPIAQSDNCPSDKASDVILRGSLPQAVIDILRIIAAGSDFVENQNFALIHQIVLKLTPGDLEEHLRDWPDDVDLPDGAGRTALEWASARGDERAVVTLLSYGADPNNMDRMLNTPLTLAANQNHTVCVRLLLEAGALPDPQLPPGVKFGTPLNCAARNAADPLLVKTLLDFDANIEASGVDGVTPLLHVARGNSASHAMVLLEYGANINAISKSGQTPLLAAICHNNHGVLRLLLERWYEYSECPRLKGPHLLTTVAKYADVETINLLASTDHLRVKNDEDFLLVDYLTLLDQRVDYSEKLSMAFEGLITVLQETAPHGGSVESRMESGLLLPVSPTRSDDTDSDQTFEDAKESFQSARTQWKPLAILQRATM